MPPHQTLPSDLGEVRTIMAADRTLMAWIRTALSMLSLGFTICKALEALATRDGLARPDSPQVVGLFLCGMSVVAILLGTTSYYTTLKQVRQTDEFSLRGLVLIMASIMSVAGIALFVGIATRVA